MASSTTSPVASVMPKRVSVLTENPSSLTKAKVPISETGMVTAGMMVLRQSARKIKMTRMTRTMASIRVLSTSRIDSPTASVVSNAFSYFMPGGKCWDSRSSSARTRRSTSRAFAVESWVTRDPRRRNRCTSDLNCNLRRRVRPGPHLSSEPKSIGSRLQNDVFKL